MKTTDFYSSATGTLSVNGGRDENAPQGVSLSIDDLSYIKQGSRVNENSNSFTPTQAQLDAMNSGITSESVEQITTNKNNISLIDSKTPKIYKFTGTGSTTSNSMDISTFPSGFFMVTVGSSYISQGEVRRYGVSVYMFYKFTNETIGEWTPIVEVPNAKISSYTLTDNTLTINYDIEAFHATNILSIN